ncbi:cell division protein FtsX [Desulfofustis limnaeus]|jgi:cell division transport system permease protein|uniref:Cell division protein FtsX n=1 Tax=Desulfofustis limnaeus TaxID=2740163 RepID=A0ABM7W7U5_9BACT|nr:permease-like cell division protein FtsX [Desulfofustis limnaeus]MDX9894684.1 permease-like cell division protein FtsX [Desulfofustis sp.]BDD86950.1 cell division protein FtsX [Desulfofustis limnaeus]
MNFWFAVFRQVARNLKQTWPSQFMTLLTVSLSVLIFAFFSLVYLNMLGVGDKLGDDLRLIVYLEEEPGPEMQEQLRRKILAFDEVQEIRFVSKSEAYDRFAEQLDDDRDVLDDMPEDFLPASIEVVPMKNLRSLSQVKLFSEYLSRLPGTLKVQYGQDWIERFYYFTRLLSIVVLLSGGLLIMTSVFMVSYTIRLVILGRQAELELLKLVGATNNYIRTPFLIEGILQGMLGSTLGIVSLYSLFHWIKMRFSGPGILSIFEFSFFQGATILMIVLVSVLLCTVGSYLSMRKFLRM